MTRHQSFRYALALLLSLLSGTAPATPREIDSQELPPSMEALTDTYRHRTGYCAGCTLVLGAPFDETLLDELEREQQHFADFFLKKGLSHCIRLYDPEQLHATLIEVASQHPQNAGSGYLTPYEWNFNASGDPIKVHYTYEWARAHKPITLEFSEKALNEAHKGQSLRITSTGLIVIKGRATPDSDVLSKIRADFHENANIEHKYGDQDDEIYIVLGQLLPRRELEDPEFTLELRAFISQRQKELKIEATFDKARLIYYNRRDLHPMHILWKRSLNINFWTFDRRGP